MTRQNPVPLHRLTATSTGSAWEGSLRKPWEGMPKRWSTALAAPNSGSRMKENSTPCAVAETTNGTKNRVR